MGRRAFLTTGRQGLAAFAGLGELWFLVRCVDPPECALPPRHLLILDRGPYTLAGELTLFDAHGIDLLVSKDSGGGQVAAKLAAARERGAPVVMVRRPGRPDGAGRRDRRGGRRVARRPRRAQPGWRRGV